MSLTRQIPRLAAALAFFLSAAAWMPSHGAVIITATETAGNVVFSFTGSVITAGLSSTGSGVFDSSTIAPTSSGFTSAGDFLGATPNFYFNSVLTGPAAFGTGSSFTADSSSGDPLEFFPGATGLRLKFGYTSGAALSGSMTFNSKTFTTLGVTPGSYVYEIKDGSNNLVDTITMNIGAGAVPEPSRALLAGLGLGGLLLRRRRVARA